MINQQSGITLVEMMVSTTILSIGVSLAVPSWTDMVNKRNVASGAEEVVAFLAHAQNYALKSNQEVTVTFSRDADGKAWCMGAIDEVAKLAGSLDHCDCNTTAQCTIDGQESVIDEGSFDSLVIHQSRVQGNPSLEFDFNYDPVRGLITTDLGSVDTNRYALVLKANDSGHQLRITTLATGRNRICNPTDNGKMPAYKQCND